MKQDRQAPRTATDLERKYAFGKSFAEAFDLATDARNEAEEAKEAAEQVDKNLDQEEIFNRLTNNGEEQGIYREDGKIYVNASYIKTGILMANLLQAGVLKSNDGTTFYLDLDNGILKGNFAELLIGGNTVDNIAKAQVEAQTQTDIFNKLTANGTLPGLFMENGQLYVNASYLKSGIIDASLVQVINLIAEKLSSTSGYSTLSIDGAKIDISTAGVGQTFSVVNYSDNTPYLYMTQYDSSGNRTGQSQFGANRMQIGGIWASPKFGVFVEDDGSVSMRIGDTFKTISWEANSDGTYSIVGR